MTKIKVLFALMVVGMVAGIARAEKESVFDGWQYTEFGATGAITDLGALRVKAVYVSSQATSVSGVAVNYVVLVDSPLVMNNGIPPGPSYFGAQQRSPALTFLSTNTAVNSTPGGMYQAISFGEDGVFCSSAAGVYFSAIASGFAGRAGILWRK